MISHLSPRGSVPHVSPCLLSRLPALLLLPCTGALISSEYRSRYNGSPPLKKKSELSFALILLHFCPGKIQHGLCRLHYKTFKQLQIIDEVAQLPVCFEKELTLYLLRTTVTTNPIQNVTYRVHIEGNERVRCNKSAVKVAVKQNLNTKFIP